MLVTLSALVNCQSLLACPFCTALKPSLAQLREQATVVALAEVQSQAADKRSTLALHKVLRGAEKLPRKDRLDAVLDALRSADRAERMARTADEPGS